MTNHNETRRHVPEPCAGPRHGWRRIAAATALAIPVLALVLSACSVDSVRMRVPTLSEADGAVWLPADAVRYYRCDGGLKLFCDTTLSKLSDQLCRCVRYP